MWQAEVLVNLQWQVKVSPYVTKLRTHSNSNNCYELTEFLGFGFTRIWYRSCSSHVGAPLFQDAWWKTSSGVSEEGRSNREPVYGSISASSAVCWTFEPLYLLLWEGKWSGMCWDIFIMMILFTNATLPAYHHFTICKQVLFVKLNVAFCQVCNELLTSIF